MDIHRSSGDTQYTLRVRDNQGICEFRNRKLSCLTTGGAGTVMELQNTATGEVRIGGSSARVGIGTAPNISYYLDVGGTVRLICLVPGLKKGNPFFCFGVLKPKPR